MQEIKFRQPVFMQGKFNSWHYWGFVRNREFIAPCYDPERAKEQSQQYTGLKDKNGKEIYEGDILEQTAIASYPGEYGGEIDLLYTGEVVIIPSKGVCLKRPTVIDNLEDIEKWTCNYYKNIASYRCKIIGNICENPELLK